MPKINEINSDLKYRHKIYEVAEKNNIFISFSNDGFVIVDGDFRKCHIYGEIGSIFSTFKGIYNYILMYIRYRKINKIKDGVSKHLFSLL